MDVQKQITISDSKGITL